MLDSKHVKLVWAGRPRQITHVVSTDVKDVRRRAFTPTFSISKPLVRRSSIDSSMVLKTKTLSVKKDTSGTIPPPQILHRAHSFREVIVRESPPKKQTTVPLATKLTHEPEIKPILKSGKGSYVLPATEDDSNERSDNDSPKSSAGQDGKFCYKLPEKPSPKLRKTVSFKEDMVSSRTVLSFKRHIRSPMLSIPNGVHGKDGQVFV